MSTDQSSPPSDADLVALIDGELDPAAAEALEARLRSEPALTARSQRLAAATQGLAAAFALALEAAPQDRLAAALAAAEAAAAPATAAPRRLGRGFFAAAAAVVLVAAGVAAGYFAAGRLLPAATTEATPPGWREVVADYVSLYTPETLSTVSDDPALRSRELAQLSSALDVDLSASAVALPDLALKRGQLLRFRDMPLGQIVYLSPRFGVVALCVIDNGRPDAPPAFETRDGMNIVFWTKGGRGYLIIGRVPREPLEDYAAAIESRVS